MKFGKKLCACWNESHIGPIVLLFDLFLLRLCNNLNSFMPGKGVEVSTSKPTCITNPTSWHINWWSLSFQGILGGCFISLCGPIWFKYTSIWCQYCLVEWNDLDKLISMAVPKDLEKPSQSTNCFQIVKESTWIMFDPLEHGTNAFTHFALYRFSKTAFESNIYLKT